MLRLIDAKGRKHPITCYENYHIKHVADGCDTMEFDIDTSDEVYQYIQEECRVENEKNNWVIKKIDDDRISCELDFDFLKTRMYSNYESTSRTLSQVLEAHLPNGWSVDGANVISAECTMKLDHGTDFDVIYKCMSTYKVCFVWSIRDKVLKVVDTDKIVPSGEYLTSELNLKALSFKGDTTEFATRLYAYGKDGVTIEKAVVTVDGVEVEYGKPYVDNNEYTDKVICAYFEDNRYTIPNHLYEECVSRAKTIAFPVRSYECNVLDLAKQNSDYKFLEFTMHKKIVLIDTDRRIKVVHLIVEYDEYPDEPESNKVTLSCVPKTIRSSVESKIGSTEEKIEQTRTDFDYRLNMATAMLSSAFGGYVIQDGGELFITDNPVPEEAVVVWRFNINGIGKSTSGIGGPYTTSLTVDDTFITNLVQAMIIRGDYIEANSISADKINQSYTDGVLSQSFIAAEGLVEASFNEVTKYLTNEDGTGELDVLKTNLFNLQATINGLEMEYSKTFSGGINYVKNSSGLNLTNGWTYTGTVDSLQNADTKGHTVSNSCFRIKEGSTLSQTIENAVVGCTYRLTAKVKTTSVYPATCTVTYNGESTLELFSFAEKTGWTEYSVLIKDVQNSNITLTFSSDGDCLYVADILISEGEGVASWTPAPNEIYTTNVKVDGSGISVSNDRRRTVMNSEEFAGYYDDEQVFKLDDDETKVSKIVVSESATINVLRIVPYDNDSDGTPEGVNIILLD